MGIKVRIIEVDGDADEVLGALARHGIVPSEPQLAIERMATDFVTPRGMPEGLTAPFSMGSVVKEPDPPEPDPKPEPAPATNGKADKGVKKAAYKKYPKGGLGAALGGFIVEVAIRQMVGTMTLTAKTVSDYMKNPDYGDLVPDLFNERGGAMNKVRRNNLECIGKMFSGSVKYLKGCGHTVALVKNKMGPSDTSYQLEMRIAFKWDEKTLASFEGAKGDAQG